MLFTGDYLLVKISGLHIINNTLLPDYDGLVLFKDYSDIIADINNVRYEFNNIVGEGSGFCFVSAGMRLIGSRILHEYSYSLVCLPPVFRFLYPSNMSLKIDQIFSSI